MNDKFVNQKGDVLLLDDGEGYVVSGQIEFNGDKYLLMKKIKRELAENFDRVKSEVQFVKEIIKGDECYLETIIDNELLKSLISEGVKIVGDK
ncbi:MAG: hypothetical protein J6J33_04795 [Clostridia bacterium]|nr:hypothetical protein [Clostridia bacterium]